MSAKIYEDIMQDPFSRSARQIVRNNLPESYLPITDRVAGTTPENDYIRSLILNEPNGDFEGHFPVVTSDDRHRHRELRKLQVERIQEDQQLYREVVSRLYHAISARSKLAIDPLTSRTDLAANSEIWKSLTREVFGTDDPGLITNGYSKELRQLVRMSILNCIEDRKQIIRRGRTLMKTAEKNDSGMYVISATEAAKLLNEEITAPSVIEVTEAALILYPDSCDSKSIFKRINGYTLYGKSLPPELQSAVIAIDRKDLSEQELSEISNNTKDVKFSGLQQEVTDTRVHELSHSSFARHIRDQDLLVRIDVRGSMYEIDLCAEAFSESLSMHQKLSKFLRSQFEQGARDELIAYYTSTEVKTPRYDALRFTDYRRTLGLVEECLWLGDSLSVEEQDVVLDVYRRDLHEAFCDVNVYHRKVDALRADRRKGLLPTPVKEVEVALATTPINRAHKLNCLVSEDSLKRYDVDELSRITRVVVGISKITHSFLDLENVLGQASEERRAQITPELLSDIEELIESDETFDVFLTAFSDPEKLEEVLQDSQKLKELCAVFYIKSSDMYYELFNLNPDKEIVSGLVEEVSSRILNRRPLGDMSEYVDVCLDMSLFDSKNLQILKTSLLLSMSNKDEWSTETLLLGRLERALITNESVFSGRLPTSQIDVVQQMVQPDSSDIEVRELARKLPFWSVEGRDLLQRREAFDSPDAVEALIDIVESRPACGVVLKISLDLLNKHMHSEVMESDLERLRDAVEDLTIAVVPAHLSSRMDLLTLQDWLNNRLSN